MRTGHKPPVGQRVKGGDDARGQYAFAEGDKVAVYWTMTATNLGAFRGIPPTGKRAEAEGMTLVRLRDDKSIKARSCWDATGLPTARRHRIATGSRKRI